MRHFIVMDNIFSATGNIHPESSFSNAGLPILTQPETKSGAFSVSSEPDQSQIPFFFPRSNQHLSVVNEQALSNAGNTFRSPGVRRRQEISDPQQPTHRSNFQSLASVSGNFPAFH